MPQINNKRLTLILHGFKIVILLFSIVLIVLGGVAISLDCSAKPTRSNVGSVIVMTIGIILLLTCATGFYAFSGAICAVTIFILFGTILAFAYRRQLWLDIKRELKESFENYYTNREDRECWDKMQKSNNCCGLNGHTDWLASKKTVPDSCCHNKPGIYPGLYDDLCRRSPEDEIKFLSSDGCYKVFFSSLKKQAWGIFAGGIVLSLTNIGCIVVSAWLVVRLKKGLK